MSECKYKWFKYNLNVACVKCGNKIPIQNVSGNPECDECGEINTHSWEDIFVIADLKDLRKNQVGHKKIFSSVEASVNSTSVADIECYQCKTKIDLQEDLSDTKSYDCKKCEQKIKLETLNSFTDMFFYSYGKQKPAETQTISLIAVRCAACGAPLETDPTKTNYHCKFCSVENILPPSLRQRKNLNDVYIGIQTKPFSPKKILETNNLYEITSCLKSNKKETFSEETLNALIQKFPDNLQVYHLITNDLKHTFSIESFEKLWGISKSTVFLNIIGQKLNKPEVEITAQIRKFDPSYKENIQSAKNKDNKISFFDKLKGFFG